jgi:hypothetical protein
MQVNRFFPCQTNPSIIKIKQYRYFIITVRLAVLMWQREPLMSNQRAGGPHNVSMHLPRPNFPNAAFLFKS